MTVFNRQTEDCKLTTLVLRGSTTNLMDDVERAIDDALNVYRCTIKDGEFVAGAGATEINLAAKLEHQASLLTGLE